MTTLAFSHRWSRAEILTNPLIFAVVVSVRWTRRYLRRRAARHSLEAMPDYLLKDIGVSRSDVAVETEFERLRRLGPCYRL